MLKISASKILHRFHKRAGGSDFGVFIKIPDPAKAYSQAVDAARYEHGSGGYTGTIAEKRGYKIITRTPLSMDGAYVLADKNEDNDKWGPALAIPIGAEKQGKSKEIKINVDADSEQDARNKTSDEVSKLFPGKQIKIDYKKSEKLKGAKIKTRKAPFSRDSEFWWSRTGAIPGWTSGNKYKTKQEAVAAFKAIVDRLSTNDGFKNGEIWTLHEHNNVVAIETFGKSSVWRVIVEVTPEESVGPIIGWYFYGVASS